MRFDKGNSHEKNYFEKLKTKFSKIKILKASRTLINLKKLKDLCKKVMRLFMEDG